MCFKLQVTKYSSVNGKNSNASTLHVYHTNDIGVDRNIGTRKVQDFREHAIHANKYVKRLIIICVRNMLSSRPLQ